MSDFPLCGGEPCAACFVAMKPAPRGRPSQLMAEINASREALWPSIWALNEQSGVYTWVGKPSLRLCEYHMWREARAEGNAALLAAWTLFLGAEPNGKSQEADGEDLAV